MKKQLIISILLLLLFSVSYSQESNIDLYKEVKSDIYYKRFEDAKTKLNNLIKENNRDQTAYMLLGETFFKQNKYTEAANQYKKAMKLNNKIASYKIAECYALLNSEVSAVEYLKLYLKTNSKILQSEIKLNPAFSNIENSKSWINLWKGEHYTNYEKRLDEAKYLISKEKYTEAFDITDYLLHKNKRRHKALAMRGDIFIHKGEYKNAAKEYSLASEIKKKSYQYNKKAALAYFTIKKYNKAINYCNLAIKNNPLETDILLLKTKIEINTKKYDEAQNTINQFLKYYPDNAEALNLAGAILYNKRKYIEALEKFNLCLKNNTPKAEYFIGRADTYMAVSMYENAVSDYSMALDLNPKLPEVYYKKGIANLKAFNNEDACADFHKATELGYYKASDYIVKYCK
ncbi:MAG: tetratricopeptide repeat protein [Bacteroidales bacterium]|nr:tetratricopeptide repeat protein [Bacteroidales bacterium]